MYRYKLLLTHKKDEDYMAQMCHAGWAARRVVEGLWTFEPCAPGEYVYRVAYLRGKSPEETEALKKELAARGIEFVSQYFFWAIFRSRKDFRLYTPDEERVLCRQIRTPMVAGAVGSWFVFILSVWLAQKITAGFWVLAALAALYGVLCTSFSIAYTKLLHELS